MQYERYRRQTTIISTIGVLVFIVLTTAIFLWVNGFKIDLQARTLEQTALISIEGKLQGVEVLLNGKEMGSRTPIQLRSLSPGRYELQVRKDGYNSFVRTFFLDRGQVGVVGDIELVATQPLVTDLPASARFITPVIASTGLTLFQGELYDGDRFVTRFSTEPYQVHRYPTFYLYQLGNEFRVFFPETNQDFSILRVEGSEYLPINALPSSMAFILNRNGEKKLVNLTIPTEVAATSN